MTDLVSPPCKGGTLFFRATVPFLPPGINHSYQIVPWQNQQGEWKHKLVDSPEAHAFKDSATDYLCLRQGNQMIDDDVLKMISTSKKKVPVYAIIRFYFKTMWKRDIDGGEKHLIDVVVKYLVWKGYKINDNQVTDKFTSKRADRENIRCEISLYLAEEEGLGW